MSQLDQTEIYRCKKCGKLSVSIGWLHGHIEKHRGWGPFNILPPLSVGNYDKLMEYTEVIEIVDVEFRDEPTEVNH